MKESLYIVGAGTVIGVCICIAYLVINGIIRGMRILKYRYKKKHRYDKPPTAKCYCRDCIFHQDGVCYNFINAHTFDDFFVVGLKERKTKNE